MRLLAGCSSGGCPSVEVADDGSIVVQGELLEHIRGYREWSGQGTPPATYRMRDSSRDEARVRIPADVLWRAAMALLAPSGWPQTCTEAHSGPLTWNESH